MNTVNTNTVNTNTVNMNTVNTNTVNTNTVNTNTFFVPFKAFLILKTPVNTNKFRLFPGIRTNESIPYIQGFIQAYATRLEARIFERVFF